MNDQDGDLEVGAAVDFEKVKRALLLFFASAIRGVIIAAVAKLSPALVEDASVKVTVEVLSTVAAISLVALVSTRSTLKKIAAAAVAGSGEDAVSLDRVVGGEPPALTGSRVGPKE